MTDEEAKAVSCVECGFYHGAHKLNCSLLTVEYCLVLLNAANLREQRNSRAWHCQREKAAFWQGKFNTVRHENNKLRRANALTRKVADAAAGVEVALGALKRAGQVEEFLSDAVMMLSEATYAARDSLHAAVREYRAHVEGVDGC